MATATTIAVPTQTAQTARDLARMLKMLAPYRSRGMPGWPAAALIRDGRLYASMGTVQARMAGDHGRVDGPDGAWYLFDVMAALRGSQPVRFRARGAGLHIEPLDVTVPAAGMPEGDPLHLFASDVEAVPVGPVSAAVWAALRRYTAQDDIRPILRGIALRGEPGTGWRLVATDGTRLLEWTADTTAWPREGVDTVTVPAVPLPPRGLVHVSLLRRCGTVIGAELATEAVAVRVLSLVGAYPHYERVLPDPREAVGQTVFADTAWIAVQAAYAQARRLTRRAQDVAIAFGEGGGEGAYSRDLGSGAITGTVPGLFGGPLPVSFALPLLADGITALPAVAATVRHYTVVKASPEPITIHQTVAGGRLLAVLLPLRQYA